MKRINRRWTEEEEKLLVKLVSQNPQNLNIGFKEAAIQLYRTETAVRLHWYKGGVRKRVIDGTLKSNYSFITISPSKTIILGKTCVPESGHKIMPQETKLSIWKKIKLLFGL